MAAEIGHRFKMDPVAVLDSTTDDWLVRFACLLYLNGEDKKQADKIKSSSRRGR